MTHEQSLEQAWSQFEAGQEEIALEITEKLNSESFKYNFEGMDLISMIRNQTKREYFEQLAFNIICRILNEIKSANPTSINTALDAIMHIECLSGESKIIALNLASRVYEGFKHAEITKINEHQLENFFNVLDDESDSFPLLKKAPEPLTKD